MSVKGVARAQFARMVNHAAAQMRDIRQPSRGWLMLLREALGLSGSQVAARMGVSRNAVYQAERNEQDGAITIAQMRKIAEAMDAEFVYAVVPRESVEATLEAQARRKAEERVGRASTHMALENQSLPDDRIRQRIDSLTEEFLRKPPPDFWEIK